MKKKIKRIFIFTLAIVLIVLGLIGLVLPFLQGFLFLALGILLMSLYSPTVRAALERHTVKYPRLHALVLKAEGWIVKIFGRPEE